jgi:hypothetical protein
VPHSRPSIALYWRLVDLFRADPGPWALAWTQWSIRTSIARALQLTVSLECGDDAAMAASVDVKAGTSLTSSRAAARELGPLARLLARRGYDVRPPVAYYPLVAHRPLPPRAFVAERRFLSTLARATSGSLAAHPRSALELADAFRGRLAGAWRPSVATWEWRRPVRLAGRTAVVVLMFHVAPAGTGDRRPLRAASSLTLWPPWEGRGPFPSWLASARRTLDRQLRAAGHEPEWHRGPEGRGVVVTSFRGDLRSPRAVAAERRRLESAHLGDEP